MTDAPREDPANPEELVRDLDEIYRTFLHSDTRGDRSFAELLSGWFMPPGHSVPVPGEEEFVTAVSAAATQLAESLQAAAPEQQDRYASEALRIMIRPPLPIPSPSQKLYVCAVQEQGVALTAFLSEASRDELRRLMKEEEKPRRQLPSQRHLYQALGG